ncbi:helix-turn-helix domain-containing protein [Streptomyces katsurahamanus]|uniref:Helix-turn-helix domain-containing protein n=1 Tax=Streptomyces katsurahamanus TaxID=2577098 RepID=A0ABW9NPQ7_9ACTN|nr:helix-turn-helix domain-containing protein [Streptomyces katsurahamanus]
MWSEESTDAIPAPERAEWYQDVVARAIAPTRTALTDPCSFRASTTVLDLGLLQVSTFTYGALRSWRTPTLIRRGDPELFSLALMSRNSMWISQRRNDASLSAGDAVLFDSSRPFEAGTGPLPDPASRGTAAPLPGTVGSVMVHLPREALRLPPGDVDRLLARRLCARSGLGAILGQFVQSLERHALECAPQERERVGRALLDLTTAFVAQQLNACQELPAETRRRVLLERINVFIDQRLADPGLTPELIAARHHISLRSLYALFQQSQGESVAASIRRRRLERCRAELARTGPGAPHIQTVAQHAGFTSAAVFSRAFRSVYGVSPREFRKEATAGRPVHGSSRDRTF